jgi:hypothetical protein
MPVLSAIATIGWLGCLLWAIQNRRYALQVVFFVLVVASALWTATEWAGRL